MAWGPWPSTTEGVKQAAWTAARFLLMVLTASLLPLTTTPLVLTDGLERLLSSFEAAGGSRSCAGHDDVHHPPLHPRHPGGSGENHGWPRRPGRRAGSGKPLSPVKHAVSILIPLFVSTIRRAEELALSMESRCWRGGKERTRSAGAAVSRSWTRPFGRCWRGGCGGRAVVGRLGGNRRVFRMVHEEGRGRARRDIFRRPAIQGVRKCRG